jgi:hypothetical protein
MILGFFFWSYFEQILAHMQARGATFKAAESRLSAGVTHEQVGQLLLLRANMPRDVVQAVSTHHQPPSPRSPLASLIHLADNLCKDLGMGYLPDERGEYSDSVLRGAESGRGGPQPAQGQVSRLDEGRDRGALRALHPGLSYFIS